MESSTEPPPHAPAVGAVVRARRAPRDWTTFDLMFGIVLPLFCLVADPGILRGRGMSAVGPHILQSNVVAVYGAVVPAIVLFGVWCTWRRGPLLLAGPLLVGGCVSLAIGIALLPLSIMMSIALIGLLGLVPLGTAFAYLRNGLQAFRAARTAHSGAVAALMAVGLGAAVLALPLGAQAVVNARTTEAVAAALAGDARREAEAIAALKPFGWLIDDERFVAAWTAAADPVVRDRLARVWHGATGDELRDTID